MIRNVIVIVAAFVLVMSGVSKAAAAAPAVAAAAPEGEIGPDGKIYIVAASHLDTQWWWTIQETITDLLTPTFSDTFYLLDKYPGFKFSWEGSFRYMLLKEYQPQVFQRIRGYVDTDRWFPGGSSVDAGDVNVPSTESLARQFLYGNGYFKREFGKTSVDVFLPDCFGFGWALPSVAAHFGLKGFSSAKLEWGGAIPIPFPIGRWEGPDGASLVAALNPGSYTNQFTVDPGLDPVRIAAMDLQESLSGLRLAFAYFGVGDRGGAPGESTVAVVEAAIARTEGPQVVSAPSDQIFRDLTDVQVAELPVHRGELVMQLHGTGSYTAQSAMKRFNRKNELLADAAERASVAADWLGGRPYPLEQMTSDWIRFLWHQFHDDLTGTSIPEAYTFSWNDEILTLNRFAQVLRDAVGTVARSLDTSAQGIPVVVYNPLSFERTEVVEATIATGYWDFAFVKVLGPDGSEVPSQEVKYSSYQRDIIFLATVPATGYAVYDVQFSDVSGQFDTGLKVSDRALENQRYKVELNDAGDIASIYDKLNLRQVLSAPVGITLFDDFSFVWPAWELHWEGLRDGPRERLAAPAAISVVESGPVRVAIEVKRADSQGSQFVERISLDAGGTGDTVKVDMDIDWRSYATLLKATFPMAVSNADATYDLGLGTIRRGINTDKLFEVPAQQWADISAPDNSYGVSVTSDCKYGWDHPDAGTLRLTLIHTPAGASYNHQTLDFGNNHLAFGISGHSGDWRNGAPERAAQFNQPLMAFATASHEGENGKTWAFLSLAEGDRDRVAVRAVKADEAGRGLTIVRLQELKGEAAAGVQIAAASGISKAWKMDGMETEVSPLQVVGGKAVIDMTPYQMVTVGLELVPVAQRLPTTPEAVPIVLDFDRDVVSTDEDRADGAFDSSGATWSAAMWPGQFVHSGIPYSLGPTGPGEKNALTCKGQTIELEVEEGQRLYMLMAATEDVAEMYFNIGLMGTRFPVQAWTGFIGQWDSEVVGGEIVLSRDEMTPGFVKPDPVALYGSHRHAPGGDEAYVFTYMYRHVLPLFAGTVQLQLPDDPRIHIFAMTLAAEPADDTEYATSLFDDHDPLHSSGLHLPDPETPVESDPGEHADEAADVAEVVDDAGVDSQVGSDIPAVADVVADTSEPGSGGGCSAGQTDGGAGVLFGLVLAAVMLFVLRRKFTFR
jgi:alpha-mannosidase